MAWFRKAVVVFAAAMIVYLAHPNILRFAASWLDVSEPPRQSNYVLTLPGDEQSRPFVSAALVNVGLADKALVLGTAASPAVEDNISMPSDEVTQLVLERRGVPESQVLLLKGDSVSTFSDANVLHEFLKTQPNVTVAIVTNPFHTRRARWVFRRVLQERANQVYFVAAPMDNLNPNSWWTCEKGVRVYLGEFGKYFLYLIRYGGFETYGPLVGSTLLLALLLFWRSRHRWSREQGRPLST